VHDVDRSPLTLNCAPALGFCRLIVSLRFVRGRIGLAAAKLRKAAGDAPSLSSLPRASIGVGVRFGAVSCIAGPASARLRTVKFKGRPSETPLLSFHSLQRLQVTPRCLALPRAVAVPL